MFWKWLAVMLRGWASEAHIRAIDALREDLREEQAVGKAKDSQIALLEAEIEALTAWRSRELSRLEAEATIFRGRKTLATEMPAIDQP